MVDLHQEFQNSRFFHEARIDRRSADALVGLAAGIAADGKINLQEARFLEDWIGKNLLHLEDPVVNILFRRLSDMLSDGVLDEAESQELLSMLQGFSGLSTRKPMPSDHAFMPANSLPLCAPVPDLILPGMQYVFTGVMAFGPRKNCEGLIVDRGGSVGNSVTKKTNYLVIGGIGNDQWRHSTYGTKIIRAVELREAGAPLSIISEQHWQASIFA